MSSYSDWRCGALTDEEYESVYRHERGEDHGEDEEERKNILADLRYEMLCDERSGIL